MELLFALLGDFRETNGYRWTPVQTIFTQRHRLITQQGDSNVSVISRISGNACLSEGPLCVRPTMTLQGIRTKRLQRRVCATRVQLDKLD